MNLQSSKVIIQKSQNQAFDLLCDVENFKKLMPENTSKFEVKNVDTFTFALQGMPEIELMLKNKIPTKSIVFGSTNDKFLFSLSINIEPETETSSTIFFDFNGEFNAMMSMMIKGPISKFIENLANNTLKL